MAKARKANRSLFPAGEWAKWNFVIFLTLAFILLVIVTAAMQNTSEDVKVKAGLACAQVSLPDPSACATKWQLTKNANGCPVFECPTR